jgi:hypothetical protein
MKRLTQRLRRFTRPEVNNLRPQLPRPEHTVEIKKRDYELLRTRGFTEQLAPRYFKHIAIGSIVCIRQLFEADAAKFCLARLEKDPTNPFMRAYVRRKK